MLGNYVVNQIQKVSHACRRGAGRADGISAARPALANLSSDENGSSSLKITLSFALERLKGIDSN